MSKPLLSIGIIFKNEIRCLERCLKSLQPLRDALPCELVMAATGSGDGSRKVAERYADILIDFPWIDDFSAARNAVLDRCSGKWHFFIDADEWLDGDFSELTAFLRKGKNPARSALVVQRNYMTPDAGGEYRDFYATRLCRLLPGLRFQGTVHERGSGVNLAPAILLRRVVLHHDGYAYQTEEQKRQKARRNMELLRGELERDPENLLRLLQCLESGRFEPDYLSLLYRAVAAVERRAVGWEKYGPPILRYAVHTAQVKELPELKTWAAWAEEWFPDSFFTRIDVESLLFAQAWKEEDYGQCVRRGERYLKAMDDNRTGRGDQAARSHSTLIMESPQQERKIHIFLAGAYLRAGQEERAVELLRHIDGGDLDAEQTRWFTLTLHELQTRTMYDAAPLVSAFWEQFSQPKPNQKRADERKNTVYGTAFNVFMQKARDEETQKEDFCRHAYTLYLPLRDKCEPGRAAAILETEDVTEMAGLLSQVERWDALPIQALVRALDYGVTFPLPDRPLNMEEMDGLIGRLAKEKLFPLARRVLTEDFAANGQALLWARGLSMAAARVFDWNGENADVDTGLSVARSFAQTEKEFLPFCYAPQVLREENLSALPPMHRFGWYCVQAFEALDSGDAVSYVRLLRTGLGVCKNVKDMVEFLLEHTSELQTRLEPSAELLALAEQVRTLLANFAPDDPAVAALKASPVYQRVARFVEGAVPLNPVRTGSETSIEGAFMTRTPYLPS